MKKIKPCLFLLLIVILLTALPLPVSAASKIHLSQTKATLYVNDSITLKISGTKKRVQWSSNNLKVAIVFSGRVFTKKPGTAVITAKVSNKTYKCRITVKKRMSGTPKLNHTDLQLDAKETAKLTVKPTKGSVTWKSSDTAIAKVDSKGKVTGVNAGICSISAYTGGKTATCRVDVTRGTITGPVQSLYVGDTFQLKLTNYSGKVTWTIKNKKVVTGVAKGGTLNLTAKKAGSSYIIAHVSSVDYTYIVGVCSPGRETKWKYSADRKTRTKTLYDGKKLTEHKYTMNGFTVWGYFDRDAAKEMLRRLNAATGKHMTLRNDLFSMDDACVAYSCNGGPPLIHLYTGGMPRPSRDIQWIVCPDFIADNAKIALSVFVVDINEMNSYFGKSYRTAFLLYYGGDWVD